MTLDQVRADRPVARAGPSAVVAGETARTVLRSALLWGVIFGGYVAASAFGYAATYKSAAERSELATTFGANLGFNALIGPAHNLDTVAGFTAWRSLGVLSVVGAVWALLAATRQLRGEEDAGRWELLLAGATTRRTAAAHALLGLGSGVVTVWVTSTVIVVLVGRASDIGFSVGDAAYLCLALVASVAMFLSVGALTSQLAPNRRQAAGYAFAVLGVSYALRMVADSGTGLGALRWITPLGWVEELRPLSSPRPLVLVPIVGLTGLLSALAVWLAGARDLGGSTVPDRPEAPARTALLAGPTGLAFRLARPVLVAWLLGIAAIGLMMGYISKSVGDALSSNPAMRRVLGSLGGKGAGAEAYLAVTFLVMGLLIMIVGGGQVIAARAEEADGRLDHLIAGPVSRWSWLVGRVAIAAGAVVVAAVVAGAAAWVGAASQGAGVGLWALVEAGLNQVPAALVVIGLAVLALGMRPRWVSAVTYGVLGWSFLVELVGGVSNANHWLLDTSLFHHTAAAPVVSPNWTAAATMTLIGIACAGIGAVALRRRDLVGN